MKKYMKNRAPFKYPKWVFLIMICLLGTINTKLYAQLAEGKPKRVGNIIGYSMPSNFDNYWNAITMENSGKWDSMESTQGTFSWESNPNTILVQGYNKAVEKGYPFKAHTFVWRNQAPSWLPGLSENGQRAAVANMMDGYFERFPLTAQVDVVNEPLDGHAPAYGTNGGWMKFNGDNDIGKWSWIKWAFELAREARDANGSNAKLLINDYGILESPGNTQAYVDLVNAVNANGRNLIEGIGVQAHFAYSSSGCGSYTLDANKVKNNLDLLATTGLPIYVSEFDMNLGNDSEHATKFMALFEVFYEHPSVELITLWGYINGQTWLDCSWLVDGNSERPAIQALRTYLQDSSNNQAPIAAFTKSTSSGDSPLTIQFDASGSSDPDGDTLTYSWTFGNGQTSSSVNPQITFTGAGIYNVTLTVNDGTVNSTPVTQTVTVTGEQSGNCTFGTPTSTPLSSLNDIFDHVYVLGTGGPNLDNVTQIQFNWDLANNGIYQFGFNTSDGVPSYYFNLSNTMSHNMNSVQPDVTLISTGVPGMDGAYWTTIDAGNLVMVSKTGGFTLYFTDSSTPPNCNTTIFARLLSYDSEKNISTITLAPNPVQEAITLSDDASLQNSIIKIMGLSGRTVLSTSIKENKKQKTIDLQRLQSGVYLLEVLNTKTGIRTIKRIVKE